MANSRSPFDTYQPFGGESSRTRRTPYEHVITEDGYVPADMPDHVLYAKLGITFVQDDDSDVRHPARRPAPIYVDNKSSRDKPAARSAADSDNRIDSKLAKKIDERRLATKAPSFAQALEKPSPPPLVNPAWAPRSLYVKRSKRQDRPELLDYRIEIDENNMSKIFTNDGKIPRGARWCRYHYDGRKHRGFDHNQHRGCLPRENHLPCELQHDLDDCEDFALDLTPDNQLEEMVLRSAYMDVNKGKHWPDVDAVLADIRRRKNSPQVKGIARQLGMKPWPKSTKGSLRAPREAPRDYKAPNLINDKKSSSLWNAEFTKDYKAPNLINDKKSSLWNAEFTKNEEYRKQKPLPDFVAMLAEDKAKRAKEQADKEKEETSMRSAFQNAINNFARALKDKEYDKSKDGESASYYFALLCSLSDDKSNDCHEVAAEYLAKLDQMVSVSGPDNAAAECQSPKKDEPGEAHGNQRG
ncbi:hypothetical protein BLS_004912 [Venturia inaequalis]|uniref:Uncharacterized protein n=1 Tax=Venturia inaequalis TaxID=5025 RepID=A0A8H3UIR8_VENIN|nr:hypothetical protein BLS_004912 [Venturia inaequalis]